MHTVCDAMYLPMPQLVSRTAEGISFLTDDALYAACGVRIAFTGRAGGVSEGAFSSLNLGDHVGDDPCAVVQNRTRLLQALHADAAQLITLNQVHGDTVLVVEDASSDEFSAVRAQARSGADAIVVGACEVAPVLCFADCVPVIIVSPCGAFAVAHAGWRGVMAGTARAALHQLASLDVRRGVAPSVREAAATFNAYIGPHIGACCFQTGHDVRLRFAERFGNDVLTGDDRVDLAAALRIDLEAEGVSAERIAQSDRCTVCNAQEYFSYRASGGTCGRHGAAAVRRCAPCP
ncbi:polyphenol oxidase family protein [Adlercreutzia murintestinalis]|uniref:polyphenol oxidase family protein n=1 Tax=Adlercreutzia murintestinalis TaxID=2941325 RepID=UPI00204163FE|nr:polyphenol oxidase family protein [Adlercreutzia murintestinalis]